MATPSSSTAMVKVPPITSGAATSTSLIRKNNDVDLMPPPPPPKRIKRPPIVLDEDTYTDALSNIIARDFFPGLLEAQHQQDYLDALDSKDPVWIRAAEKRLAEVMTPQYRNQLRRKGSMTPSNTSFTPASGVWGSSRVLVTPTPTSSARGMETPTSVLSDALSISSTATAGNKKLEVDMSLSLDAFQAKYTSEDNASFNDILDAQNLKRRGKYAWMWNGNKIPSKRAQMAARILRERKEKEMERRRKALGYGGGGEPGEDGHIGDDDMEGTDEGGQQKSIAWIDDRKAAPETWKSKPRNGLMFTPEGVEEENPQLALAAPPQHSQSAENKPILPPKSISYANTRLLPQDSFSLLPQAPSSPSMSAIQDAIAGYPRPSPSSIFEDGNATPRVNGYAFVDEDEPSPPPPPLNIPLPKSNDSSFSAGGPFKIAATPRRELLLNRMVEKVAKGKRASAAVAAAAATIGGKTPGKTPRTPMTPAGRILWRSVSATPGEGVARVFGEGGFERKTPRVGGVGGTPRIIATPRGKGR